MKVTKFYPACVALLILAVTTAVITAQQPAPPRAEVDPSTQLRIKKIVGTGRQALVKTPIYNTNAPRSAAKEQDWYQLWVQYETAPAWMDEVVFSFHVLARTKVQGRDIFSLYRKTVKYVDVEQGRAHMSTVFLRPSALKRYGEVVAAAVVVTVDGKTAAEESEVIMPNIPEKWWQNPAVTENAAVTVREGYLLDRSQTPFAFINVDDYEAIK